VSIKDRLAAKSAMIGSTPKTAKAVEDGPTRPKTAPGQLMSSLPFLAEKERELREMVQENETLREQLKNGTATEVSLEELHEVPGRRRKLTPEQYAELKENLRRNLLVQAITVRKRAAGGGYEIVSGHNRVAIYRELGRDRIPAVFFQGADDYVTEASALYANLFQPDLTDFEKYLGFKKLLDQTGKTQKELAADSGADEKSVSRWMSFGDLPEGALKIIEYSPSCIGGSAVMALAAIARDGNADAVISAVKAIASGAVTQEAGVRLAKESKVATAKPARPTPVTIRQGKSVYCKVVGAKQSLRIDFQSEEARIAAEQAIHTVLTDFATPKK
jgi:ParB family transcriptional regulator, chromosome partitioning protein